MGTVMSGPCPLMACPSPHTHRVWTWIHFFVFHLSALPSESLEETAQRDTPDWRSYFYNPTPVPLVPEVGSSQGYAQTIPGKGPDIASSMQTLWVLHWSGLARSWLQHKTSSTKSIETAMSRVWPWIHPCVSYLAAFAC